MESHFPTKVKVLLSELNAPGKLQLHLELVHQTSFKLLDGIKQNWPESVVDSKLVLIGAASHDLGKLLVPEELHHPGKRHEALGEQLLLEQGFLAETARFARTHGSVAYETLPIEDLLVIAADTLWKGARIMELEEQIARTLSEQLPSDYWDVFVQMDELFSALSEGAAERLAKTQ